MLVTCHPMIMLPCPLLKIFLLVSCFALHFLSLSFFPPFPPPRWVPPVPPRCIETLCSLLLCAERPAFSLWFILPVCCWIFALFSSTSAFDFSCSPWILFPCVELLSQIWPLLAHFVVICIKITELHQLGCICVWVHFLVFLLDKREKEK